jgi:hypothetical protein
MRGRREKEKVKRNGKRGQLRTYDPLDFSRFTASENAAGGFFQQPHQRNPQQKQHYPQYRQKIEKDYGGKKMNSVSQGVGNKKITEVIGKIGAGDGI